MAEGTSYRLTPIPGVQAIPPRRRQGQIYLFTEKTSQSKDTGFYKIGKTTDWQQRLQDLQTGNPRKIGHVYHAEVSDMDAAASAAYEATIAYKSKEGGETGWYYADRQQVNDFKIWIVIAIEPYKLKAVKALQARGYGH